MQNTFSDYTIYQKSYLEKSLTIWKLNNILLNKAWVKGVTGELRKYLETNDKNTTYQNL